MASEIFHEMSIDQKTAINNYQPKVIGAIESKLSQYSIYHRPFLSFSKKTIEEINDLQIVNENASIIENQIKVANVILKANLNNPSTIYSK